MRVRESQCRPCGLPIPTPPGTAVPGFHIPPLWGLISETSIRDFVKKLVLTNTLKARYFEGGLNSASEAAPFQRLVSSSDKYQ